MGFPALIHTVAYWTLHPEIAAVNARSSIGSNHKEPAQDSNGADKKSGRPLMQERLDQHPELVRIRQSTMQRPFGTNKASMGATHLPIKVPPHVRTVMRLQVLACNLKRVIAQNIPTLLRSSPCDGQGRFPRSFYQSSDDAHNWVLTSYEYRPSPHRARSVRRLRWTPRSGLNLASPSASHPLCESAT
jgi:hypothetical protein